jgi:hypothetical protein
LIDNFSFFGLNILITNERSLVVFIGGAAPEERGATH